MRKKQVWAHETLNSIENLKHAKLHYVSSSQHFRSSGFNQITLKKKLLNEQPTLKDEHEGRDANENDKHTQALITHLPKGFMFTLFDISAGWEGETQSIKENLNKQHLMIMINLKHMFLVCHCRR